ncbi:fumarate/nitrate reduction transcriptional regulator Fnr [Caldimonas tepidiphila]|uniref:fumarate/nitrate reduction transcriptional regulator Fnr n=1 Tax=Caldimonas tepidiphila TaxID=2315841 RepID=UPI000E5AA305|nr:fumarate/nitrate reduction transcriptional regulator Fnr [Caldimonas tepidiphila]
MEPSRNLVPPKEGALPPIQPDALRSACSNCTLRELCLPVGLSPEDLEHLDRVISKRRMLRRGEALFRAGDRFEALYAVRSGFLKTTVSKEDGREQVTGFQMSGEILGLDGIGSAQHTCDAIAIEDASVCVIPFEELERLSREVGELQRQLHKVMSREIVRDQGVMFLLGSMRAEQRVAAFLLNLTKRLKARGYSSSALVLRMSREEIGSYLGLKLETVSRAFSKLQQEGILAVRQREIEILRSEALGALANE